MPRWRAILHRWFVQYNPLYFASALSILAGVFLVARELPPDAFESKLGVAACTEVYQFLLIAGAVVLLRAGLKRPAAILGIAAFVFILDVAFNGERLMSFMGLMSLEPGMRARRAVPASIAFALLGPVKLWLLSRVFRLRNAGGPLAIAGSVILALPLLPYIVELESTVVSVRQSLYLGLTWLGAPLLGWAFTPRARQWTSAWTADAPDPWLTRNIAAVAPFLVSTLFVIHSIGWRSLSDLSLSPAQAAPYLLVLTVVAALRVAREAPGFAEFLSWIGSGATLWSAYFSPFSTGAWPLAAMAILTGACLVFLVETTRVRVFLPATICLFGGAYMVAVGTSGLLPTPGPIWPAGIAVALLAGAARQRDFRCLVASTLAAAAAVRLVHPLTAYAGVVAGIWLALSSWVFFPEFRRWVPFLATAAVLACAEWMVWREVRGMDIGCGAFSFATVGVGFALKRRDFQGAGAASAAVLALLKHESWVPMSAKGWGVLLLVAGFVFLSAGVAVNLLLARRRAPATPGSAAEAASPE
jgi:hypothetical protein